MNAGPRERLSARLDWFNVRYRTVYAVGGGVLALVAVLAVFLAYRETVFDLLSKARREARLEIDTARGLEAEAATLVRDKALTALMERATAKLSEAERSYGQRDWEEARTAAIVSQGLSRTVLQRGKGEAASHDVRFYRIEGEVRVKRAGQFHWEDASSRMQLRIGDQIKTGSAGSAQILYFDGTVTTIRPESLLEIKDLYEEPATRERRVSEKLNWGEIEASTRKANVSGSFHEVQSESAQARSEEEAEFRVAYQQEKGEGSVALFSGRLDVAGARGRVGLKGGERVAIGGGGVLGSVEKLPPTPRLLVPADQQIFVFPSPREASTTLAWEEIPATSRYRLQLSERPLFSDVLLDKKDVRATTVELPGLPPASYYWRVAVVDGAGREGPFSPHRKFRITTSELRDRNDHTPPPLAVQDFVQNGPVVILSGRTEPGATVWVEGEKVDVDDAGAFISVVRLKQEGSNKIRITAQDPAGNESRRVVEALLESF